MIFLLIVVVFVHEALGHGMMLDPPNRSSMWRFDKTAPINYADNQNFCGGFPVQWEKNNGNCGVCGDNYVDPHPQKNENSGFYGLGKVPRQYEAGTIVNVSILLTANHIGTFSYSLCILDDPAAPESGEDCFVPLKFADGSDKYKVDANDKSVENKVRLPEGLTCERCVFRWHYRSGNNWGVCEDGSQALGCGPQETFRSCSDIAIVEKN